jgi:nucleotide-binding universal stress UspA family protein
LSFIRKNVTFVQYQKIYFMQDFTSILCPIDFSNFADSAVDFAVKMAGPNTTVHLCHSFDSPIRVDPFGNQFIEVNLTELATAAQTAMHNKIVQFQQKYTDVKFESHFEINDDTADSISKFATAVNAEVIVIASHGRKGLKRLLMGSVAESVMRDNKCPVVMVRP